MRSAGRDSRTTIQPGERFSAAKIDAVWAARQISSRTIRALIPVLKILASSAITCASGKK